MDKETLTKTIGKNIRRLRLQRDISQENAAFLANMHPAYFGRLERGEKCPTIDTLYKVADALNVPIYKLLENENDYITEESQPIYEIKKQLNDLPVEKQSQIAEIIDKILNF